LLLSILMAVILSIQFYFTQQTQRDIVNELTQMSDRIEKATTPDFITDTIDDFIWKANTKNGDSDQLLNITTAPDSINTLKKRLKKVYRLEDKKERRVYVTGKSENDVDIHIFDKAVKIPPGLLSSKWEKATKDSKLPHDFFIAGSDSAMNYYIREIEVDLNPVKENEKAAVVAGTGLKADRIKDAAPNFTFVVPDFSKPAEPRLLRFNYSTAELNSTLSKIRNKNILISLAIFILSIGIIMLITRRFLHPIDQLKNSFERVVDGDLALSIQNESNDEIGKLTSAFNQMVTELRKNKEKEVILRRKERLASLGQLAAGVAHEIKNPLNAINLTIEHLGDTISTQQKKASTKYITTIQKEIRRLDKIVNNFLNYLRSEELEKTETDINVLLKDTLNLYDREFASSKIEISEEFDEPFMLPADGERLKTAFVNIVLNAIQAMPGGGKLKVKTDSKEKYISFLDSGIGIEEKELENIFDIFYTTKSTGSGLGLPTAYKVIKAHGADIRITSQVNKGTEVRITFGI
jgi:signal transduction histidine kinase